MRAPQRDFMRLQAKGEDDGEKTFVRIHVDGSGRFGWEPWCHPT